MHKIFIDIYKSLQNSAWVITPNNRLSQQILEDFAKYEIANNEKKIAIDKPNCLPYQLFLKKIFNNICETFQQYSHPILLTKLQEKFLWQQVLHQDKQDGFLQEIYDAWIRCQNWQIDINDDLFTFNEQTIFFQKKCFEFQQELTKLNVITEEQIVSYIQPFFSDFKKIQNFQNIIWVCFDSYTPVQIALQNLLQVSQSSNVHFDLPDTDNTTEKYAAIDNKEETYQLINWLKQKISLGEKRIGVVVPNLEERSENLQRQLENEIAKDKFNISLGKPLIEFPLIAHAIEFLNLEHESVSHDLMRLILNSPYLGASKEEFLLRSSLIAKNEILQEPDVSFESFKKILVQKVPKLSELINNISAYPKEASAYQWSLLFKKHLKNLNFPGEYSLTSTTYQCFQRLLNLFDEFLQVGLIKQILTKNEALNIIREIAHSTIFQLKKPKCEIQILGILEASGCTFDSLWILGLTNQCLPQKTKLSPFIPASLQKTCKMPHALPEKELQLAQKTLKRLQNASRNTCIISYPQLSGELTNMPSPLIIDCLNFNAQNITYTNINNLETYDDEYQIPVFQDEKIKGGTQILANQAKCPFRSFAIHRLHAKQPLKIQEGINALNKGKIIHRIMELFFQNIPNQTTLINLTDQDIEEKITMSIADALEPWIKNNSYLLPKVMQEVEFKLLSQLVKAAISWEKERPAFTINALEKTFQFALGELKLKIRVDRIDSIESIDNNNHNTTQMVIDYKTSLPQKKPWFDERPEEPQLLLYSLLDDNIHALILLEISKGQVTCNGISDDNCEIKGIKAIKKNETWNEYKENWHNILSTLAEEFMSGICTPTPKREEICNKCWVRGICRIDSC